MKKLNQFKKHVDVLFANWAEQIVKKRWIILSVTFIIVGFLGINIPKLTVDTSNEGLLKKTDKVRVQYDHFRSLFGESEIVLLAVESDNVFDSLFLAKLQTLQNAIKNRVPHISKITSLLNARSTIGESDALLVGDFLGNFGKEPFDAEQIRRTALNNPVYVNNYVSEDGKTAMIILETQAGAAPGSENDLLAGFEDTKIDTSIEHKFLSEKENGEIVRELEKIIKEHKKDDFLIELAGTPVMFDFLKRYMMKDMQTFTKFSIILICITLLLFFRSIAGVIIPVLVVGFSVVSTLGLMGLLGVPISRPTQIIPSFLIAVGVGSAVHLLNLYFSSLKNGLSRIDALRESFRHSSLPVILCGLTTAAGLLSFSNAEIYPIAQLGIFCGFGVMATVIFSFILVPSITSFFPLPKNKKTVKQSLHPFDSFFEKLASFIISNPWKIIIVSLLIFIPLVYISITFTFFSHDPISWLPNNLTIKSDVKMIDKKIGGTSSIEILIDSKENEGLYNLDLIKRIDSLSNALKKLKTKSVTVGKVISIIDILKEVNKALNGNDPSFYKVPDSRQGIAQSLLLFENSGSDEMKKFVDNSLRIARMTVRVPWVDAVEFEGVLDNVFFYVNNIIGDKANVTITGGVTLLARTIPATLRTQTVSYGIAFIVISLLMLLITANFRLGIFLLLPNLLPIVIVLAFVAIIKTPLDIMTILIGSIAMGLVVDDTLHYLYTVQRSFSEKEDIFLAISQGLKTTGQSMIITSVVLFGGFIIYLFAEMSNVKRFGIMTSLIIVFALFFDLTLTPAILTVFLNKKLKPVK